MNSNNTWSIIIGLSLIISAFLLGSKFVDAKRVNKKVTVKGLSERVVEADRAWWSISTQFGGHSVNEVKAKINSNLSVITDFLDKKGFSKEEYKTDNIKVYQNNYRDAVHAFNGEVRINITTSDVNKLDAAVSAVGELIESGILLSGDKWSAGPKYFYTKFTEIKPEMLAEATVEAKKAAEEFAKNSNSKVGDISYANQGVIRILPSNRTNEDEVFYREKLIRVVSTVDYFLE
jgi:hypothetical protein